MMTTQRIVLAWSSLDLEGWRHGDLIVALTAEAYVVGNGTSGAVLLDPKLILPASSDLHEEATQLVNILHESLKSSRFPWIEAYANVIFQAKTFQLITWLKLIRSLRSHVSPRLLEISPPRLFSSGSSLPSDSFFYGLSQRSFEIARDILQREGIRFNGPQNSLPLSRKVRLTRASALRLGRCFSQVAWKMCRSKRQR